MDLQARSMPRLALSCVKGMTVEMVCVHTTARVLVIDRGSKRRDKIDDEHGTLCSFPVAFVAT